MAQVPAKSNCGVARPPGKEVTVKPTNRNAPSG
jgi:hypothetical protein